MAHKRMILEMGTGNDLYGADYTKAALRAVDDALHHSSLTVFKSCGIDHGAMTVVVTIAVQEPDQVDIARVAAALPRGKAEVRAVKGGLNVADPGGDTPHVIATAAVEAFVPDQTGAWTLIED